MSQETYLKNLTPQQRENYLRDNAASADDGKYMKPLSEEEIQVAKDRNINNAMKLGDWQEELDNYKAEYKEKMEPLQKENKLLLTEIRTCQRLATGTVYHLPNYDEGTMEDYNELGEFLGSRKLLPTERQGLISHMRRASNE